jgi:alkylation response protein AidB-like acyl-CoA dehydrogenase
VRGGGLALTAACFTGAAALVGIFAVALMRAAFEFTLGFARNERRGGTHPIIEHQAVGYALADAKMAIEVARCFCGGRAKRSMCNRLARRTGDRRKSPRLGADGSHASGWRRELRSCSSVRAPAAGCAGAFSLWWRQHRRPTSTASRDPETAGIRSADHQWRGGGLTNAKFPC